MTIYLPHKIRDFKEEFEKQCDRIHKIQTYEGLCSELPKLMNALRTHPLTKNIILNFEEELQKREKDFDNAALETIEFEWLELWKQNPSSLEHRKKLVRIKRKITQPIEIIVGSLYTGLVFSLKENGANLTKIEALEKKFNIPRGTEIERTVQAGAETNPFFCWMQFKNFEKIALAQSFPMFVPIKGPWRIIRKKAWQNAKEKHDQAFAFCSKSASGLKNFKFVDQDHLKKCLNYIKYHLLNQLRKIEEQPYLSPSDTQNSWFVEDLAQKYWASYPEAKRDEVYEDYQSNCPPQKKLSRSHWERIVREKKLDPRPKSKQTRGKAKEKP